MLNNYLIKTIGLTGLAICLISSIDSQWYTNLKEKVSSPYETRQNSQRTTPASDEEKLEVLEPTYPRIPIELENKTNYPSNINAPRKIIPKMLTREERAEVC